MIYIFISLPQPVQKAFLTWTRCGWLLDRSKCRCASDSVLYCV